MHFLITAHDGKDEEAPARRAAVRPAHLEVAGKLKELGHILIGGAILDDNENMIGSAMVVDFDSREELDQWINNDPYVTGNVWQDITVVPYRIAVKT